MKKEAPSVQAVKAFNSGEKGSLAPLLGTFIGRGLLLSTTIAIFHSQDSALKTGFIASATIEAYLLWYFKGQGS